MGFTAHEHDLVIGSHQVCDENLQDNVERNAVFHLVRVLLPSEPLFGSMQDGLRLMGDILPPAGAQWSALSGEEDEDAFFARAAATMRISRAA